MREKSKVFTLRLYGKIISRNDNGSSLEVHADEYDANSWKDHVLVSLTTARTFISCSKNVLSTAGDYRPTHWRRQLWGTGARAPLDFQLVILGITRFTDSDERGISAIA